MAPGMRPEPARVRRKDHRPMTAKPNTNPNKTDEDAHATRDKLIAMITECTGTDWKAPDIADAIMAEYDLWPKVQGYWPQDG